jgi:hypothetical protein
VCSATIISTALIQLFGRSDECRSILTGNDILSGRSDATEGSEVDAVSRSGSWWSSQMEVGRCAKSLRERWSKLDVDAGVFQMEELRGADVYSEQSSFCADETQPTPGWTAYADHDYRLLPNS